MDMIFRRPAKPGPRRREALSAQQTETGGGLTPMLYLERWGNMTNKLTPSRLASILQAADDGDITEQHVLFADMEDRCEHLAAEIGKRKRALLTLDWEILPGRAKDKRAEEVAAAVREQFDMLPTTSDLLLDLVSRPLRLSGRKPAACISRRPSITARKAGFRSCGKTAMYCGCGMVPMKGPNCGPLVGSFTRTAVNPAGFRASGFFARWRGRT